MIHSIRVKMVAMLGMIVTGTMLICVLLNTVFLQHYYLTSKETNLNFIYYKMKNIQDFSALTQDQQFSLMRQCEKNGVSLIVIAPDGSYVFENGSRLLQKTMSYILNNDQDKSLLESQNVVNTISVQSSEDYYLEMHGYLSGNYFYTMCVAVSGVQENVAISNKFLIYVSLISLLMSILFMWLASMKFTQPIKDLVRLSERMCNLDFEARYVPLGRQTEVDMLGNSMNNLSEKLEETIVDLKKANLELQRDIDKKTEVDNMRKDFISNVSHELKTPIALIQGYAEGLKEGINDGDKDGMDYYCDVIMDEANRMNHLVRNLLALNQLEYGNAPLEMSRFDLISVIDGVLNSVKLLIDQKDAKIIFDNRQSVMAWGDEFQVEQVITNYLNNALNHLDENKMVKITVEERDDLIHVEVFNSGKHIPDEDIDKIWIKFYKVDKARTREYGGNGIGLSIVKAIMDLHNRQCGVKNVEGGVTFWFELDGSKGIQDNTIQNNTITEKG